MGEDSPAQWLNQQLSENYSRPFTYAEAERRFGGSIDNFQQTFANVVKQEGYVRQPLEMEPIFTLQFEEETLDALVGLRDYLDESDAWYQSKSFRTHDNRGNRLVEGYREAVPELTEERLDQLYDADLVSQHGFISIITDKGWWAIYTTSGEDVYRPQH